jgi:hypothetical protein
MTEAECVAELFKMYQKLAGKSWELITCICNNWIKQKGFIKSMKDYSIKCYGLFYSIINVSNNLILQIIIIPQ